MYGGSIQNAIFQDTRALAFHSCMPSLCTAENICRVLFDQHTQLFALQKPLKSDKQVATRHEFEDCTLFVSQSQGQ